MSQIISDAFKTLGVPPDAKKEDLKRAYRILALKFHPDRNRGNEEAAKALFLEVEAAYKFLSDKQKVDFCIQYGDAAYLEVINDGVDFDASSKQYIARNPIGAPSAANMSFEMCPEMEMFAQFLASGQSGTFHINIPAPGSPPLNHAAYGNKKTSKSHSRGNKDSNPTAYEETLPANCGWKKTSKSHARGNKDSNPTAYEETLPANCGGKKTSKSHAHGGKDSNPVAYEETLPANCGGKKTSKSHARGNNDSNPVACEETLHANCGGKKTSKSHAHGGKDSNPVACEETLIANQDEPKKVAVMAECEVSTHEANVSKVSFLQTLKELIFRIIVVLFSFIIPCAANHGTSGSNSSIAMVTEKDNSSSNSSVMTDVQASSSNVSVISEEDESILPKDVCEISFETLKRLIFCRSSEVRASTIGQILSKKKGYFCSSGRTPFQELKFRNYIVIANEDDEGKEGNHNYKMVI